MRYVKPILFTAMTVAFTIYFALAVQFVLTEGGEGTAFVVLLTGCGLLPAWSGVRSAWRDARRSSYSQTFN